MLEKHLRDVTEILGSCGCVCQIKEERLVVFTEVPSGGVMSRLRKSKIIF